MSNQTAPKIRRNLNMFDKLVESASTGADVGPRRRIFILSFLFVAVLFSTAVIASIYAADYDLGNDMFDAARMLTPVIESEPPPAPEAAREPEDQPTSRSDSDLTRRILMAATDEPSLVPDKPSAEVNPYASTPSDKWEIARLGKADSPPGYSDRPAEGGTSSGNPVGNTDTGVDENLPKEAPPLPKIVKDRPPVSGGAMTGKATYLPQPVYSAAALAVRAQGIVVVQITVDETGKVISAKALDGNALLRPAATAAALKARFKPTTLSGVPVKVTGLITYNFKR